MDSCSPSRTCSSTSSGERPDVGATGGSNGENKRSGPRKMALFFPFWVQHAESNSPSQLEESLLRVPVKKNNTAKRPRPRPLRFRNLQIPCQSCGVMQSTLKCNQPRTRSFLRRAGPRRGRCGLVAIPVPVSLSKYLKF